MAEYKIEFLVPEYRNLWDVLCAEVQTEETQPDAMVDFNSVESHGLLAHADPFTLSRPKALIQATIQFLAIAQCENKCAEIGQLCDEAEAQEDWEKVTCLMEQRQLEIWKIRQLRIPMRYRILPFQSCSENPL